MVIRWALNLKEHSYKSKLLVASDLYLLRENSVLFLLFCFAFPIHDLVDNNWEMILHMSTNVQTKSEKDSGTLLFWYL
jgi:hypothetical protein